MAQVHVTAWCLYRFFSLDSRGDNFLLLLFLSSCFQNYVFIVVVVHARILYGTNAQETKITLFGDGGDKLVGCFRQGTAAVAKKERNTENESQLSIPGVESFPSLRQNIFHPWVKTFSSLGQKVSDECMHSLIHAHFFHFNCATALLSWVSHQNWQC